MVKPKLYQSTLTTPSPERAMPPEVPSSVASTDATQESSSVSSPLPPPIPPAVHAENKNVVSDENKEPLESAESTEETERLQILAALKSRLNADTLRLARRGWVLILILILGLCLLGYVLKQIHYYMVGRYAVLEDVVVTQNRGNQGQIEISYRVVTPGRVHCSRVSGNVKTDLIYDYREACEDRQAWNWNYVPGEPIDVTLWSRKGTSGEQHTFNFPTSDVVDIVILMDTTESMDSSIQALKEKCQEFAMKLKEQALTPRFALVGFGDAVLGGDWISISEFTEDATQFLETVDNVPRFKGGDPAESSLDALEFAIEKVKKVSEGHAIRFYLVTDQVFHAETADGLYNVESIGLALQENRVMLEVFCHPRFRNDYELLLGDCGHFREIENFGEVLSRGRFLED